MKFAFIDAEKVNWPVARLCGALRVSKSGFYAWKARPESRHACEDRRLGVLIGEAHSHSRRTYGSPRVHAELAANGEHVSRKRVARRMRELGLEGRPAGAVSRPQTARMTSQPRRTCSIATSQQRLRTSAGSAM